MKILVIAPHPDDEVLGCGATIAKHVQAGNEVHLCIVTEPYTPDWSEEYINNKLKEIDRSSNVLGIKKIHFLSLPTVLLDTLPQKEINAALSNVINDVKPDTVYLPHKGDLNCDHRIIFESSLVALRPLFHKVKRLMCYEVLSETEWGQPLTPFYPTVYEDVSSTFSFKLAAMEEYNSELKESPHPRSLEIIEALAKKRGSEINVKFAECFTLIREIR